MYRLHSSPCTAPWNRWVVRDVFYGCDMLRPLNDDQSTFECALRAAKCGKLHLWKESTSVNPRLGTISCQCRCRKEFLKASEFQLWSLWGAHCEWRVVILHCDRKKTPRNLRWAKFGASWKPSEASCEPFWTLADASGDILEVFSAIFVRLQVRRPGFILFSKNYDTILVSKLRRKWFWRGTQKSSEFWHWFQ